MLGISHAPELLILLVIAFMVFGPEKLPELARGAGKGLREFRRMSSELQQSFNDTVQEVQAPFQEVQQQVQQHVQDMTRITNESLQQPWTPPLVPAPSYVPPSAASDVPDLATINSAAAEAQHDPAHAAAVTDVPAAHVAPAARRPSIAAVTAPLAAGAGGRLSLEPAASAAPAEATPAGVVTADAPVATAAPVDLPRASDGHVPAQDAGVQRPDLTAASEPPAPPA